MARLVEKVSYWKLAIYKLASSSLVIGISTFIAATAAMDWDNMSGSSKFIVVLSAVVAMLKNVDSFLSDTMQRLKFGKEAAEFDSRLNAFEKPKE